MKQFINSIPAGFYVSLQPAARFQEEDWDVIRANSILPEDAGKNLRFGIVLD